MTPLTPLKPVKPSYLWGYDATDWPWGWHHWSTEDVGGTPVYIETYGLTEEERRKKRSDAFQALAEELFPEVERQPIVMPCASEDKRCRRVTSRVEVY